MSTEENVKKLSKFISKDQLGVKRNETAITPKSFNDEDLVKQVTYLIGYEIAQGNHTPITPEFVSATLGVSLSEAETALKALMR